jgi:uncharacterized protein YjbI with pentapeptide repeats
MQHPQDEKKNDEDANPGNNASIGGDTGPGSVTGSGSVQAENIAGRDIIINSSNDTEIEKSRDRLYVTGNARRIDVERLVAWYREQGKRPDLTGVDLRDAVLRDIDLRNVDLERANLSNTNLVGAKLQGANLKDADLLQIDLRNAEFDENTTLPDGRTWNQNIDLNDFTHSWYEFW